MHDSTCAGHRLSTLITHVFGKELVKPSLAAIRMQELVEDVFVLNAVFRKSPKATRLLKDEQVGKTDPATGKPVVVVGCKGTALIRWSGHGVAMLRVQRILPYAARIVYGDTAAELNAYEAKVRRCGVGRESRAGAVRRCSTNCAERTWWRRCRREVWIRQSV